MNIRIVDGRLTRDAEVKVNQNTGKKFLTFTLANNGFSRGAQTTTFFNVVSYNAHDIEKIEDYKKGKLVIVTGRPDEVMAIKGNNTYLNRNIVAHNIEGTSYGAVKENTQGQTTTYRDVAPVAATCEVPQIPSQTVAVTSPQVTVMGTNQPQTQVQQPQMQPAYSAVVNHPYDYQAPQFTDKINSDDDLPF